VTTSPPRIVILANHQHAGLAAALRALLPAAQIASFDLATLVHDGQERREATHAVASASHIIGHDAPAAFGGVSTAHLRAARRKLHLLPSFRFAGFHPDTVAVSLDRTPISGPTGLLHARIAAAAFLAGLRVPDAAALYNSLVFARLGYYAAFATERARLLQTFAVYGYDLAPLFDVWLKPGCFMFDPERPRMRVLLDLARMLCARMGIVPDIAAAAEASLPEPMAGAPIHPLFPEIAARLGISPEGNFRGPPHPGGGRPTLYSLDAYLAASFDTFRQIPLAALRAIDGMASAMPTLFLQEADFGRGAARLRAGMTANADDAVFLTWHGHVLGTEVATSMLVQTAVWPDSPDTTPARARLADLPVVAPTQTTLAGGTIVTPGAHPGSVTIGVRDRLLSAPRHVLAPRFANNIASNNELFCPLRPTDLAILRELAAGDWIISPGDAPLTGRFMTVRAGFSLHLGTHRIDLATARFHRTDSAGAAVRIEIVTPNESLVLTATGHKPAAAIVGYAAADLDIMPIAASVEQFRALPGHRLHVQGPPELLHLPLVVDDASRIWLHEKHPHHVPLRLGRHSVRASAARAADKFILLARGAEGVIFDGGGIWANAEFHTALPGAQAAHAAPRLEVPVCVFYTPNLHDFSHWLIEAALCLHILQPILPPDTRLLLPGTLPDLTATGSFDHMAVLAELGLAGMPMVRVQAPLVRAADVTWLEHDTIGAMPASVVQSFRARVHAAHAPSATSRRIFVKPRHAGGASIAAAAQFLVQGHDFEIICPDELTFAQQIDLFAAAEFVVAPHGGSLAGLLFCQPRTRVIELSPDSAFNPMFWQISEKLGLYHAVLPCAVADGDMVVEMARLRPLFRMLRLMA
jgi:hypothetical protein